MNFSDNISFEHHLIVLGFFLEIVLALLINCIPQYFPVSNDEIIQFTLLALAIFGVIVIIIAVWVAYKYVKTVKEISENNITTLKEVSEKTIQQINTSSNYIEDLDVRDVTLKYFSKEILITPEMLDNGCCKVKHIIYIYNHMDQRYDNYVYNISSTSTITEPPAYKILKDGIPIDAAKSFKIYEVTTDEYNAKCSKPDCNGCTTKENGCKLYVPIGLKPKHECKLEILEEHSPSFKKLQNYADSASESLEFIGITVNHDIEIMEFSIALSDDMPKEYTIVRGYEADAEREHETFKVLDRSDQRMEQYENLLESRKCIPKFSDNGRKLTWKIYYPKKCYSYVLYFTISNKQTNGDC